MDGLAWHEMAASSTNKETSNGACELKQRQPDLSGSQPIQAEWTEEEKMQGGYRWRRIWRQTALALALEVYAGELRRSYRAVTNLWPSSEPHETCLNSMAVAEGGPKTVG